MLIEISPKLPMRNKTTTKTFYVNQLGFKDVSSMDFDGYLILQKDKIQIHFFEFKELNPKENYGQTYIRVEGIDTYYQELLKNKTDIHPNGHLQIKPWSQKEFSVLDPDYNLITFGQSI